jgi:hypothetical protein
MNKKMYRYLESLDSDNVLKKYEEAPIKYRENLYFSLACVNMNTECFKLVPAELLENEYFCLSVLANANIDMFKSYKNLFNPKHKKIGIYLLENNIKLNSNEIQDVSHFIKLDDKKEILNTINDISIYINENTLISEDEKVKRISQLLGGLFRCMDKSLKMDKEILFEIIRRNQDFYLFDSFDERLLNDKSFAKEVLENYYKEKIVDNPRNKKGSPWKCNMQSFTSNVKDDDEIIDLILKINDDYILEYLSIEKLQDIATIRKVLNYAQNNNWLDKDRKFISYYLTTSLNECKWLRIMARDNGIDFNPGCIDKEKNIQDLNSLIALINEQDLLSRINKNNCYNKSIKIKF